MDNSRVHWRSRDLEHLLDLYLFKGRPINKDPDHKVVVLINHGYAVGFSPDRLQPLWAAYRVAGSDRDVDFDRPHLYYDDRRLNKKWQIGADTFGKHNNVRYHVGHMVPNEVINRQFGRLAQMETFLMSNMSPQRGSLNTGVWLSLENMIRKIKDTPDKDHIWAIAGPIFSDDPELIRRPNGTKVPIPDAYYYITVDPFRYPWDRPRNVDIACFKIEQGARGGNPLTKYLVELDEIEELTKLSFFPEWVADGVDVLGSFAVADGDASIGTPATRHRLLAQLAD